MQGHWRWVKAGSACFSDPAVQSVADLPEVQPDGPFPYPIVVPESQVMAAVAAGSPATTLSDADYEEDDDVDDDDDDIDLDDDDDDEDGEDEDDEDADLADAEDLKSERPAAATKSRTSTRAQSTRRTQAAPAAGSARSRRTQAAGKAAAAAAASTATSTWRRGGEGQYDLEQTATPARRVKLAGPLRVRTGIKLEPLCVMLYDFSQKHLLIEGTPSEFVNNSLIAWAWYLGPDTWGPLWALIASAMADQGVTGLPPGYRRRSSPAA